MTPLSLLSRLSSESLSPLPRMAAKVVNQISKNGSGVKMEEIPPIVFNTRASLGRVEDWMNDEAKRNTLTKFTIFNKTKEGRVRVKGIRVGAARKNDTNIVLVSGLPFQSSSAICVNLYAMFHLAKAKDKLPCAVSFVPVAYPRDHTEMVSAMAKSELARSNDEETFESPFPFPFYLPRSENRRTQSVMDAKSKATYQSIQAYLDMYNRHHEHIGIDVTKNGTTMDPSHPSLPSFPSSHIQPSELSIVFPQMNKLSIPSPALVAGITCAQELNAEQIVTRGNEVVEMVKEMAESTNNSEYVHLSL